MLGVVGVRACIAGLFLIQMEIDSGRLGIFGNSAIGVKLGIFAAAKKPLEHRFFSASRIARRVPA